jgi:hypothetical protein
VLYDLYSQNRKNKNYQTQTHSIAGMNARCMSTGEMAEGRMGSGRREMVKSQSKWREDSEGRLGTKRTK